MFEFLIGRQDSVLVKVRVQPRASKNQLAGVLDGALKIRLTAPPVDGEANKQCLEFMAGLFGLPRSRVSIESGHTGRNKIIKVEGLTLQSARVLLEKVMTSG